MTEKELTFNKIQKDGIKIDNYNYIENYIEYQDNKYLVMEAVKQDGLASKHASDKLKNDYSIVLKSVKQNGLALQYASDKLKNDYSIVMAAVRQNGNALEYASDKLKNDYSIVTAAVGKKRKRCKRKKKLLDWLF